MKSKKKKLLFSRESESIQPLRALIEEQRHRTLVQWALDCAPKFLDIFENKYPDDQRPRQLIEIAKEWASGEIKMAAAKKAILATHNAATDVEENPDAEAAARAIAHAAATIHVETHALGLVFYGLTAIIYQGNENQEETINKELQWFYDKLLYWQDNIESLSTTWAPFLLRDNIPNKEKLLRIKERIK